MKDPVTPLTPEEVIALEARASKEGYLHRDLVAIDQAANVVVGGKPDETLSARAARAAEAGKTWGKLASAFLNLFQKDHGPKAQAGDEERAKAAEKLEETSGGFRS